MLENQKLLMRENSNNYCKNLEVNNIKNTEIDVNELNVSDNRYITPENIKSLKRDMTKINHCETVNETLVNGSNDANDSVIISSASCEKISDNSIKVSKKKEFIPKKNNNREKKKITVIIGDSIIKEVNGYKLSKSLANDQSVVVKAFPGAKIQCMNHHVMPTLERRPDQIILHCGTNNLPTDETPVQIAKNIIDLAINARQNIKEVAISAITTRFDKCSGKANKVNLLLEKLCSKHNLDYIPHNHSL